MVAKDFILSLYLQTLILSRNKIKDWPGEILKLLPGLVCLKLDNNLLKQVGDVC